MKTVSFQGSQLTSGQRRQLEFRRQTQTSFLNVHLQETVNRAIVAADEYAERESRRFFFDNYETERMRSMLKKVSAPCFADFIGH